MKATQKTILYCQACRTSNRHEVKFQTIKSPEYICARCGSVKTRK